MTSKNEIIVALKHEASVARQHLETSLSLLEQSQRHIRFLESQIRGLMAMLLDGELFWRSALSDIVPSAWASLIGCGHPGLPSGCASDGSLVKAAAPSESSQTVFRSRAPLATPGRDASLLQVGATTILASPVAPSLAPMPLLWMQWSSEMAHEWKQGLFDALSESNGRHHAASTVGAHAVQEEVVRLRAELRVERYKATHRLEERERVLTSRRVADHDAFAECLGCVNRHLDTVTGLFTQATMETVDVFASTVAAEVVGNCQLSDAFDENNAVVKAWLFSRVEELQLALHGYGGGGGTDVARYVSQQATSQSQVSSPGMVSRFEQLLLLSPGAD